MPTLPRKVRRSITLGREVHAALWHSSIPCSGKAPGAAGRIPRLDAAGTNLLQPHCTFSLTISPRERRSTPRCGRIFLYGAALPPHRSVSRRSLTPQRARCLVAWHGAGIRLSTGLRCCAARVYACRNSGYHRTTSTPRTVCALAAKLVASGDVQDFGQQQEGFIVIPRLRGEARQHVTHLNTFIV